MADSELLDQRLELIQNHCSDHANDLELYFDPVQKTWDATISDVLVVADASSFDEMLEGVEAYLEL